MMMLKGQGHFQIESYTRIVPIYQIYYPLLFVSRAGVPLVKSYVEFDFKNSDTREWKLSGSTIKGKKNRADGC